MTSYLTAICLLLLSVLSIETPQSSALLTPELSPQDGFFNNPLQPDLGSVGARLIRKTAARYSDGAYAMAGVHRPNPLEISEKLHSRQGGQSTFGRNAMSVFFGQLVMDEILATGQPGCPPEYEGLPLPVNHSWANVTHRHMVYQRSAYDHSTGYNAPRQQINGVTAFVDGGVIYGNARLWTNELRSYNDSGMLSVDNPSISSSFPDTNRKQLPLSNHPPPRDHTLKPASRLFAIGNAKGHETPQLLALQVVWHRYHNSIVKDINNSVSSGNMTNDQIFNTARKRVIAHFQKIIMHEWLPAFLNGNRTQTQVLESYSGYHPQVRPDITQEFRTAMNFRYSLMPGAVWTLGISSGSELVKTFTRGRGPKNELRNVTSIRLCNHYWDSQDAVRENLEEILLGMIFTQSEQEDQYVAADLRNFFYGPYEFTRRDVVGVEIQRDRDHGIGDLNTILKGYGLAAVNSWGQLCDPKLAQELYNSAAPDDVDVFTGAMLTKDYVNGIPSLFRQIILEQFSRLRIADRFWYENHLNDSQMFTPEEVSEIMQITFKDVLRKTTLLNVSGLDNVFLCSGPLCLAPPSLNNDSDPEVDVCTPLETYDYIRGSEVSFALSWTALALVAPASVGMLLLLARQRAKSRHQKAARQSRQCIEENRGRFRAREWQGPRSGERNVTVEFQPKRKKIMVRDGTGKELRFIDLRRTETAEIRHPACSLCTLVSLRIDGEVDLILSFLEPEGFQRFMTELREFLNALGIIMGVFFTAEEEIRRESMNRDDRQSVLDDFFRSACLQVWPNDKIPFSDIGRGRRDKVLSLRLTRTEFAEAVGLTPSSIFVRNIFMLADTNDDGFLTFDEFLRLFAVFLAGTAEQKARLMFNIYDVGQTGELTREDFYRMVKSLMELSEAPMVVENENAVKNLVNIMFAHAGLMDEDKMTFQHFHRVFASSEYISMMQAATLCSRGTVMQHAAGAAPRNINTLKRDLVESYRVGSRPAARRRTHMRVAMHEPTRHPSLVSCLSCECWHSFARYVQLYSRHIFWLSLYTLVTCGIFIERAYYYSRGREQAGLRRVSGAWVTTMTRGSASVIMFTYASLLLTMCRNVITRLRETFLHRYIPFDSAVAFHKYIALLALIATFIHIFGHGINLYCMCTQSTIAANCLFTEFYRPSDEVVVFHYWAFQTITGLTGVLVTALVFVMYVFSVQWARRNIFRAFWLTHMLYPLVYLLTLLHGLGRLVQDPLFGWYLIGPLVIFLLDRLASVSRNKIEIPVLRVEMLPSDVLKLKFKRPTNFVYKSGQWVRIACLKLGRSEYHPFTLTSAPHQRDLTLHIRAVGPWTMNLRNAYDKVLLGEDSYPKLFLDGPFGEGHQDWYTFEVSVLVGGGIGVTPFASILKDIAFKSRINAPITWQKVYFIWVTRTQKSFEWMTDVIREVEDTDHRQVVDIQIFVTQFQQKFDLRTTMLYICERNFQKVEGRSLFTGLRATTHFGRPDFLDFFTFLGLEHPKVTRIGVFSCGPGPMTASVHSACSSMNRREGATFVHHFENF